MPLDHGFTPRRFPIDPFDAETRLRQPWSLDPSSLPADVFLTKQKNVLVILGEPPLDAITPLLHSSNLTASLLILATSRTYSIPPTVSPTVRVLRLDAPLASSDSNSSRLANVLQWADRVATVWRASPNPPEFEEVLEETFAAGFQMPPHRNSWFGSNSGGFLPSPSSSELSLSRKYTPPRSNTPEPQPGASTQRAFDALFNFLPPDSGDRFLLKHAILVTTLARQFLTGGSQVYIPPLQRPLSKRFSILGRPTDDPVPTSLSPDPYAATTNTHIVHLVPPARSSLNSALESFCLSYCFPPGSASDVPHPFIMPPAALGQALHIKTRPWSLSELIICGALDTKIGTESLSSLAKPKRACLQGLTDIVLKESEHSGREATNGDGTFQGVWMPEVPRAQQRLRRPSAPQVFHPQSDHKQSASSPSVSLLDENPSSMSLLSLKSFQSVPDVELKPTSSDHSQHPFPSTVQPSVPPAIPTRSRRRSESVQRTNAGSSDVQQSLSRSSEIPQPQQRLPRLSTPQFPRPNSVDELGVSLMSQSMPRPMSMWEPHHASMSTLSLHTRPSTQSFAPARRGHSSTLSEGAIPLREAGGYVVTSSTPRSHNFSSPGRGAEKHLAANVWPTPPSSSAGTSPSSSPYIGGPVNEGGGESDVRERAHETEIPPWADSSSLPNRKRKSFFSWLKR